MTEERDSCFDVTAERPADAPSFVWLTRDEFSAQLTPQEAIALACDLICEARRAHSGS
jgi:hypothetical protein